MNFSLLHTTLHVILQQMNLRQCNVEFRGNDGERIQAMLATSSPCPTINLTEYVASPAADAGKIVTKEKINVNEQGTDMLFNNADTSLK